MQPGFALAGISRRGKIVSGIRTGQESFGHFGAGKNWTAVPPGAFRATIVVLTMNKHDQFVGPADFHDGHVILVEQLENGAQVTVEGVSGKRYLVNFEGVIGVESESPEGMMLYGVRQTMDANGPYALISPIGTSINRRNMQRSPDSGLRLTSASLRMWSPSD
jgi:hypothetical protein